MIKDPQFTAFIERIGKKLRDTRRQRDEKLENVAKAVNISVGTLSEIENGKYEAITLRMLTSISEYYGICLAKMPEIFLTITPISLTVNFFC